MSDRDATLTDPAPDAEWQVWYQDTFDRECPRQVEVSGRGLVRGLTALWERHLAETVRPDGSEGFSRFNLWSAGTSVKISGDRAGALRLRGWVLGRRGRTRRSRISIGGGRLLRQVAMVHAHLVRAGKDSAPILALAASAADRRAFETQLMALLLTD